MLAPPEKNARERKAGAHVDLLGEGTLQAIEDEHIDVCPQEDEKEEQADLPWKGELLFLLPVNKIFLRV